MTKIGRRSFIRRTSTMIGCIITFAILGPKAVVLAASACSLVSYEMQKSSTCRVQFGPPACDESVVTVYSPNNAYVLDCRAECSVVCECNPGFVQAHGVCCNNGKCSYARRDV